MIASDDPADDAFRSKVRDWLAEHAPRHTLPEGRRLDDAEEVSRGKAWQRALFDAGFAGIALPQTVGGQGGTIGQALIFTEEEAKYRLPKGPYLSIGLGMALPLLARHGNEEQIARFALPTLKGELTWCQLFSEPAAGSDLAALRTRAVRTGASWTINGQKIWSSWAKHSDMGILVARTDPSVPKHAGLTMFVLDMRLPGIDVRPIRQISGASDFNETFLTDVTVDDRDRVGREGEGWSCCMTVLTAERLGSGSAKSSVRPLIALAAGTPCGQGTALDAGSSRLALAQALAEEEASRHLEARLRRLVASGQNPGALAGMIKLAYASRLQKTTALAIELRGLDGVAAAPDDQATRTVQRDYIWSAAMRIAGGSDEVLRNQIAERVLGMPSEIRQDKDVPFDQLH